MPDTKNIESEIETALKTASKEELSLLQILLNAPKKAGYLTTAEIEGVKPKMFNGIFKDFYEILLYLNCDNDDISFDVSNNRITS
jgi:hypothetical protein